MWSETKMPSLRLTDAEAADVAAYLGSLTNPEFEDRTFPELEEASLDEITLEFLRAGSTEIEARNSLDGHVVGGKEPLFGRTAHSAVWMFRLPHDRGI